MNEYVALRKSPVKLKQKTDSCCSDAEGFYPDKLSLQVMGGLWRMSAADLQSEVDHWRHLAQDRSRELNAFRTELDSILDILRHLQKQGVSVQPLTAAHTVNN